MEGRREPASKCSYPHPERILRPGRALTAGVVGRDKHVFARGPRRLPQLDVDVMWTKTFRQAADALTPYRVVIPPRIPERCPFTLDDLLDESLTYDSAVRRLYD